MVRSVLPDTVHSGLVSPNSITMDADVMFQNLLDHNAAKRVEVLIVMRKLLKNGNGHLPFHTASRSSVFDILCDVIDDSRWEVRYQCLLLIGAIIPVSNEDIDSSLHVVMPKIVLNLGHENVNVRRAALQVLHVYMKYTNNLQHFQNMFIRCGLENSEYIIRKGCIMSIGILFTSEFENENLFPLVECLAKHFVDGDASLFYPIFLAMQKINDLVGSVTFDQYLQKLDGEAESTYRRVLSKFALSDSRLSSSSGSQSSFSNGSTVNGSNKLLKYDFGIFQPSIVEKIRSDDWKIRIEAIEHMKIIIREMADFCEKISDMDEYMIFLSRLLEDSNFKIVIQVLSVYDLLIDKFRNQMKRFLKTFVTSVLKRLGDAKLVVREHAIRVIHKLMHHVRPTDVLGNLLQHRDNRNPRLREEIVNRVTAAVLTFPSYNFDFSPLCEAVSPMLIDTKRRVRLATLECFAALAQAMGPTRLLPLVSSVDAIEVNGDAEGLLTAVQARLARRILPRCTEDGGIAYAVCLPSSAGCQNRNVSPWAADMEWIMAASGSSCSSTPPSRSKDRLDSDAGHHRNESSNRQKLDSQKSKSQDSIDIYKRENNGWMNAYEIPSHSNSIQGLESEIRKLNENNIERNAELCATASIQGKTLLNHTASSSDKRHLSDGSKTKHVVVNSKIPVLTRATVKKSVSEESCLLRKPSLVRALSAERHATLPDFRRHSASHRQNSCHPHAGRVQSVILHNGKESVLRKISPGNSPLGRKPILVRSPSLNSLGHLQGDVSTTNQVLYGSYGKSMGNIGSYFRPGQGGVIVAQPAPVHLDDVNVFGVVLDENTKGSSPVTEGWELLHPNSVCSNKEDTWQKSVTTMPEVYEMHVNSPTNFGQKIITSPLNVVDNGNISIAKITREKMLKRQQEILREAEERRFVRDREQFQDQRLQELDKNEVENSTDCMEIIQSGFQELKPALQNDEVAEESKVPEASSKPETPILKPQEEHHKSAEKISSKEGSAKGLHRSSSLKTPSTLRKYAQIQAPQKNPQTSRYSLAASSLALFDESSKEVASFPNPSEALRKALKALSSDTWMGKIEGIRTIQRLAKNHANVLQMQLHPVVLALLTEVKNLRSSVSRAAILAIGDLFVSLKKNIEPDLELITSTLLSKCGETVGFIREDIEKVMTILIDTVTPNKSALAIISGGANHRNGAVRKVAAHSLLAVVEKMGATRILTTAKDVTERLLPVTAQFLMDGTPLTRYYGRKIYHILMQHPAFDKLLLRYVQPSTLRNISSILDSIRKKGAGEMPKEGVSARTFKSDAYRTGLLNRTM